MCCLFYPLRLFDCRPTFLILGVTCQVVAKRGDFPVQTTACRVTRCCRSQDMLSTFATEATVDPPRGSSPATPTLTGGSDDLTLGNSVFPLTTYDLSLTHLHYAPKKEEDLRPMPREGHEILRISNFLTERRGLAPHALSGAHSLAGRTGHLTRITFQCFSFCSVQNRPRQHACLVRLLGIRCVTFIYPMSLIL